MKNWSETKPRAELLNAQDFDEALSIETKLKERVTSILYAAHLKADQILEQVDDERHQQLRELQETTAGYKTAALENQKADAFAELLSVSADIRSEFEAMTPWLIDLVGTCLRRLIGELDDAELISRMVHEALKVTSTTYEQALTVHPDQESRILTVMSTFPERFGGVTSIETCPDMKPNTIRIGCETSVVDVALEAQLETLVTLFEQAPSNALSST
ncbi:hypothetical protein FEE96_22915 [Parasedimentitalea maritima]|uniref:Flagellar assembly protein FliH/Type III secretion system HrpE domain-containing protein n=1 Tax=Parasedimentitalea maritima TaxID=2578117 RepID=A0ABY2UNE0_9RHOB|nr:HrpE/YscL family type III secretion apparatus protein [Zongyanglinia marina]TLP55328.1 hypothetical protein FEE96_22915 [Zongyanglinia marina]